MLERAGEHPEDAELWINLSIIVQCFGQREIGLSIQSLALQHKRIYRLAAAQQPARLTLLMLCVPGDISENTPLDCLLENSDVDLIFYYVSPDDPLALPVPEHDALFVAICESDGNRKILASLEQSLAHWPQPVINKPQFIPSTGREAASKLLQDAPGLLIPPTLHAPRSLLLDIAAGQNPAIGTVCRLRCSHHRAAGRLACRTRPGQDRKRRRARRLSIQGARRGILHISLHRLQRQGRTVPQIPRCAGRRQTLCQPHGNFVELDDPLRECRHV